MYTQQGLTCPPAAMAWHYRLISCPQTTTEVGERNSDHEARKDELLDAETAVAAMQDRVDAADVAVKAAQGEVNEAVAAYTSQVGKAEEAVAEAEKLADNMVADVDRIVIVLRDDLTKLDPSIDVDEDGV